eukprot:jgi/Psemu1/17377/gm1.17377_g
MEMIGTDTRIGCSNRLRLDGLRKLSMENLQSVVQNSAEHNQMGVDGTFDTIGVTWMMDAEEKEDVRPRHDAQEGGAARDVEGRPKKSLEKIEFKHTNTTNSVSETVKVKVSLITAGAPHFQVLFTINEYSHAKKTLSLTTEPKQYEKFADLLRDYADRNCDKGDLNNLSPHLNSDLFGEKGSAKKNHWCNRVQHWKRRHSVPTCLSSELYNYDLELIKKAQQRIAFFQENKEKCHLKPPVMLQSPTSYMSRYSSSRKSPMHTPQDADLSQGLNLDNSLGNVNDCGSKFNSAKPVNHTEAAKNEDSKPINSAKGSKPTNNLI